MAGNSFSHRRFAKTVTAATAASLLPSVVLIKSQVRIHGLLLGTGRQPLLFRVAGEFYRFRRTVAGHEAGGFPRQQGQLIVEQ
jgi:hypothetical protein